MAIGLLVKADIDDIQFTQLERDGLARQMASWSAITGDSKFAASQDDARFKSTDAAQALGDAETSREVVRSAVEAMHGIERFSGEITQIIGVIDEIAFQTNLLALNAGVDLVGRTGEALQRIVGQVSEITSLVSESAASSREQATALAEVNTAVNQMDQMTQQNAAMVEQSTAASHSLAQEAGVLASLVGRFQVGSPVAVVAAGRAPVANSGKRAIASAQAKVVGYASGGAAPVEAWRDF